jgi:WS/DGAT/MGAT family acyltransferase
MDMQKPLTILGPVDTAFYYVDSRETPMNIGAVTIFDGKIDFDHFSALIDSRIHHVPLYMQKVIQAPLTLGQPTWAFDPEFAIENHVFRLHLDAPGTDEDLRELAGAVISQMLDRAKPLWEVYLIDGLAHDRTGLIWKIHHCMVDGMSAIELFLLLLDITPDSKPFSDEKPAYAPPPLPSAPEMVVEAFRRDLDTKRSLIDKLGHEVNYFSSIFADREKRRKTFIGIANLINDNLKPLKKLVINGQNSGRMQLAWNEFPLEEVKAIRATVKHASVNDVMLTVIGGAIHQYMRRHGLTPGQNFVRMLVPVNMREKEEKGEFGNRISVLPMDVPFNTDPMARLLAVADYTQMMKQSGLAHGLDMILTLPSLAPSPTQPLIWHVAPGAFAYLAHLWATNVAAPPLPLYLSGHKMLHAYGYFPLNPGNGLASVIMSYDGRITVTLVTDEAIIPHVLELNEYVQEAYTALRKAAKVPESRSAQPELPRVVETKLEPPVEKVVVTETIVTVESYVPPAPNGKATAAAVEQSVDVHTVVIDVTEPAADVQPVTEEEVAAVEPKAEAVITAAEDVISAPEPEPAISAPVTSEPELAAEPVVETVAAPQKPALFSQAWAEALKVAINDNQAYYRASTRWDAGALAFVMEADVRHGFPEPAAVLLDLDHGVCKDANALPLDEAMSHAAFVLETDYQHWMNILSGKSQPLMMLMRGTLKLKKGSMAKLMPFTQSAQELVHSAQSVS